MEIKNIRQRGNIYWIYYSNGKPAPYWKMIPESTKQEEHDGTDIVWAQRLLKIREGEVAAGKWKVPEKKENNDMLFSDFYENVFRPNHVEQQTKGTIAVYELNFKYLNKAFGTMKLKDVTRGMVIAFLSSLAKGSILGFKGNRLAKNTIAVIHSNASTMYSHAMDIEEPGIINNPFSRQSKSYKIAKKKKDFDYLRFNEVPVFMEAVSQQYATHYDHFALAIGSGGRDGELRALQYGDLQLGDEETLTLQPLVSFRRQVTRSGEVTDLKTESSRRSVPLNKELTKLLRKRKAEAFKEWIASGRDETDFADSWVFPNDVGNPIDDSNFKQRIFKPALTAAGLRTMNFHCLRHTFASLLLQSRQATLYEVSKWLGHKSIQMTANIYGHLEPTTNSQALESLPSFTARPANKTLAFQKD